MVEPCKDIAAEINGAGNDLYPANKKKLGIWSTSNMFIVIWKMIKEPGFGPDMNWTAKVDFNAVFKSTTKIFSLRV